jgi:hypothetical protein
MFVPAVLTLALAGTDARSTSSASSTSSALSTSSSLSTMPTATAATEAPTGPTAVEHSETSETSFVTGHVALGGGFALAATSTATFLWGFHTERELRSTPHDRGVVDVLLLRRNIAAAVAWPTAVLALIGVAGGVFVLAAGAGDTTAERP